MTTYEIKPAVMTDGHPTWVLWRTTSSCFAVAVVKEATNPDRAVLERAIEHLTAVGKTSANKQE